MRFHSVTSSLFALGLASTATLVLAGSIQWEPCSDLNSSVPLLCGNLSVPLDYSKEDSEITINLELVKVSAVNPPGNKSIIFNFGGPGQPNRKGLASEAAKLLNQTGGTHDLISFDTREVSRKSKKHTGTFKSLPIVCIDSNDTSSSLSLAMTPSLGQASDTALGLQWAAAELLSDACYAAMNKTGTLVGTAFAARDLIRIAEALDEDGLLRYWGLSYGTVLGATVAAMFPEKMDKVLLDGVVNVDEYYNGYDIEKYEDTDKVFRGFVKGCIATPNNCALARDNITAVELEISLLKLLQDLKYDPIVLASQIIDYSTVKNAIIQSLYDPLVWPQLATGLHGVMNKHTTELQGLASATGHDSALDAIMAVQYQLGIECSDKASRASSLSDIAPFIEELYEQSNFADIQTQTFVACSQWKMAAKERYSGSFHNIKTRNPLMLIGNTFDPFTPLASAHNVSAGFEGSVVLQHNAYGVG